MPVVADAVRLPAFTPGMRIGLFGGSFDPPHAGHREVSLVALHTVGLDQVWWLVSPQNPLKPNAPSEDLERRIAAARTLANHPRIRVTAVEADLGTTYTAETLRCLMPRLRGVDLVWMMGADNLATFHRWRDWRGIAMQVPIAVFNRPDAALKALSSPAARALAACRLPVHEAGLLPRRPAPAWVFLPTPNVPLSSTELRAMRLSS
ncbi:nicotinate-nucleotide adenylyltransferase [Bauldia sp.]|uniref:nicotinate-nucleotide adenylyltransferase n=1 Tax=Bauldia sp. TaxID=2575872 RepID=UPI003BAD64D5